jgi:cobalt-precorrin 5A hydrolase
VKKFLKENHLALECVKAVASVDAKKNEAGLLALVQKYGWEFHTYPAEVLDSVPGIENPSSFPKTYIGTRSVSEAAALKYCQDR